MFRRKPKLSIIVNLHNMRREASRTLFSLTKFYQKDTTINYEVIVIDNNSNQPVAEESVRGFGNYFKYTYIKSDTPSPVKAINAAVRKSSSDWVMCCIDGARILSPGILTKVEAILGVYPHPFIYTLGMHLGPKVQMQSVKEGYNQQVEDDLLNSVDWQSDGYELFKISSLAGSSQHGYLSHFPESNCFVMRRKDFIQLGGYDECFNLPGGGLVNLDFFNQVHEDPKFKPILLLGEASFHQFHGGVASNAMDMQQKWDQMEAEYRFIRGQRFVTAFREPVMFGTLPEVSKKFLR